MERVCERALKCIMKLYNEPKTSAIYHKMRSTKAQFKNALRSVRKSEEMIKANALASSLLNNDYYSFWKEVRKLNSCDSIQSNIINGATCEYIISLIYGGLIFVVFYMKTLVIAI